MSSSAKKSGRAPEATLPEARASDTGLVLLHGAGLGSYIWEQVKPHLNYPVIDVDFPNRGTADKTNDTATLNQYADHVLQQVEHSKLRQFVIVTHSIGGVVGLQLAEKLGHRCVGFAGISSAIPARGGSYLSCFSPAHRLRSFLSISAKGTRPPDASIRADICNGLSETQATLILKRFTPESKKLYTDKCRSLPPGVMTLYVKCLDDQAVLPEMQDRMAANLHARQIIEMQTGHLPMISKPKQLANHLNFFVPHCKGVLQK